MYDVCCRIAPAQELFGGFLFGMVKDSISGTEHGPLVVKNISRAMGRHLMTLAPDLLTGKPLQALGCRLRARIIFSSGLQV